MSKGSKIVPVRIPDDLLLRMRREIITKTLSGASKTVAIGAWIRDAIKQRLDHIKRSKKAKADSLVTCEDCKQRVPYHAIVAQWETLLGVTQYRCKMCDLLPTD